MNWIKNIEIYVITVTVLAFIELFIGLVEFGFLAGDGDKFDDECFEMRGWMWTAGFFDTISSPFLMWGASYLLDFTKNSGKAEKKNVIISHLFYLMRVFTGIWAGFIVINSHQCLGFTDYNHIPRYSEAVWYFALIHFVRLITYIPMTIIFLVFYVSNQKNVQHNNDHDQIV